MNREVFSDIHKIIERDSKSTTYKFALLRGVIDVIQDNSPYIYIINSRVFIPTGLLVEKWLIYYYPILQSNHSIPQIHGVANLSFTRHFKELISYYEPRGGFSAFYNDLKNKGIPNDMHSMFLVLCRKIRDTITSMPMKYIGRSISSQFYSIFNYENKSIVKNEVIDLELLINNFGTFSIPFEYYEAFKVLGSFINGQDSILFKWAEFSVNASNNNISINKVLNEVLKSPFTTREIKASKKIYSDILKEAGTVHCVWTGRKISNFDIDHLIPFSVWKNNDLWNLLPSDKRINNQKRDKIPSAEIIEKQKNLILDYWSLISDHQSKRFQKEIQVALLGNTPFESWRTVGVSQLQNSCNYLIEDRGFESWQP
jgi:hypothetical protein